jgi:hypothetical protein
MRPDLRTPGERTFDRSLIGLLVWANGEVLSLVAMLFAAPLISLRAALLISGFWSILILLWCLTDVVRTWKDPSARVLRFSSLGLLLLLAFASIALALSSTLLTSSDEEIVETESTD